MATIREVKRRIKTSQNISQVTRAMEMVSAVKMRKAQEAALAGREYVKELENMVSTIVSETETNKDERTKKSVFLNTSTDFKNILLIVMAPKKGLCGPLVGNLYRHVSEFVSAEDNSKGFDLSFVVLGKKGTDIVKTFKKTILADFEITEKDLSIAAIEPISDFAVQQILSGEFDAIFVAYTDFVNTMSQKPVIKQFLPIPAIPTEEVEKKTKPAFIFEPSANEVLEGMISRYSLAILYQFFLESVASEHSARMVAMKSAHDSADELISDLTLYHNKMRQNSITTELADSVSSRLTQTS